MCGRPDHGDPFFRPNRRAKALGAKWNPEKKKWYAPSGCDIARFSDLGVLPCTVADTLRTSYAAVEVATRAAKCEQCGQSIGKGMLRLAKNILFKGRATERFPTSHAAP